MSNQTLTGSFIARFSSWHFHRPPAPCQPPAAGLFPGLPLAMRLPSLRLFALRHFIALSPNLPLVLFSAVCLLPACPLQGSQRQTSPKQIGLRACTYRRSLLYVLSSFRPAWKPSEVDGRCRWDAMTHAGTHSAGSRRRIGVSFCDGSARRKDPRMTHRHRIPWIPGQIVEGSLFSEPMRVETIRPAGPDRWVVGLVGLQTEKFRSVTLTANGPYSSYTSGASPTPSPATAPSCAWAFRPTPWASPTSSIPTSVSPSPG